VSAKHHPGEIEVQERAGVRPVAERVGKSIHSTIPQAARVPGGAADGLRWPRRRGWPGVGLTSCRRARLRAGAGRADGEDRRHAAPGDPLEEVLQRAGKKVGVLAIDLAILRRLRLSSEAERRPDGISTRAAARSTPKLPQVQPDP
jgi:hypothetical protein